MVAPILGMLARAGSKLASGAAKATKTGGTRSFAKQQSDQLRNIRRRYTNEAKNFRKQAESAVGIAKENLLRAAEKSEAQASKYEYKNIVGDSKRGSEEAQAKVSAALEREAGASERTLSFNRRSFDEQQNQIARSLLRGNTGSQFYAATKQIWESAKLPDGKIDIEKANQMIMEHFGVSNMMDAVNTLSENTGVDFTINEDATKCGEQYKQATRRGMLAVARTLKE